MDDDGGEEGREVSFLRGERRSGVMGGMNAYSNGRSSETWREVDGPGSSHGSGARFYGVVSGLLENRRHPTHPIHRRPSLPMLSLRLFLLL